MALCLKQVFSKDKTFRPRKRFEPGTQRFELYKKAQASLKSGLDLRSVVRLPPGENIDDWIAVHVVDFFNRINLIYGTMAERCSETSCPVMAGGPRYEYRWQDERQYRRPAKLSAPRYMALLMDWIESLINDEDVFPTRVGESRLAGRSGSIFSFCFVFSGASFCLKLECPSRDHPGKTMMILKIFQNKCLKVLVASHSVWANLTCCGFRVFSDSWPQERKGDQYWGPDSISTAVGPQGRIFPFQASRGALS